MPLRILIESNKLWMQLVIENFKKFAKLRQQKSFENTAKEVVARLYEENDQP